MGECVFDGANFSDVFSTFKKIIKRQLDLNLRGKKALTHLSVNEWILLRDVFLLSLFFFVQISFRNNTMKEIKRINWEMLIQSFEFFQQNQ